MLHFLHYDTASIVLLHRGGAKTYVEDLPSSVLSLFPSGDTARYTTVDWKRAAASSCHDGPTWLLKTTSESSIWHGAGVEQRDTLKELAVPGIRLAK